MYMIMSTQAYVHPKSDTYTISLPVLNLEHLVKLCSLIIFCSQLICTTVSNHFVGIIIASLNFRVSTLETELASCQERILQLQVEKEKAVSDLINIRRLNK